MELTPIRNEADYHAALDKLEAVFYTKKGTSEGDHLEIFSIMIDTCESEHLPIGLPDPVGAIKFRIEQMGTKLKDLAQVLGFKSRVSEILNRKRKLSLEMIRKLNATLHIPTEVLVQKY